jgi:hypothetical protein
MSYDTLTTLHSLSAYIWLGSLFGTLVFTTLVSRRTPAGLITGATAIVRFSTRVGLPAAVVLLLTGIWMIGTGNAPEGGLWLTIGFVAWLVAACWQRTDASGGPQDARGFEFGRGDLICPTDRPRRWGRNHSGGARHLGDGRTAG